MPRIAILFLLLAPAVDAAAQTFKVTPLTDIVLHDVFIVDSTSAWMVGDSGTIFHWDGSIWSPQNSGTTATLNVVFFLDAEVGFTAGGFFNERGVILGTTDGGATWGELPISPVAPNNFFSITFLDDSLGIATGVDGLGYQTVDRGREWKAVETGTDSWILGSSNPYGPGGIHVWEDSVPPPPGWASGGFGYIGRWPQFGLPMFRQPTPTNEWLTSISMWDSTSGIAVGNAGVILRTDDGGANWLQVPSPTTFDLTGISIFPPVLFDTTGAGLVRYQAIAVGHDDTVIESIDEGKSWRRPLVPPPTSRFNYQSVARVDISVFLKDGLRLTDTHMMARSDGAAVVLEMDVQTPTSVDAEVPSVAARLEANYPNPFAGKTTISFETRDNARIRLAVYDLLGRQVALVADGRYAPGPHAVLFDASEIPPGTYLITLDTGTALASKTMVVLTE